jgi:polyhydroxyalkanoate synthase
VPSEEQTSQPADGGEVATVAAEAAGAADAALGLNPLVGTSGAELATAFQRLALRAMTQPLLGMEHYADFARAIARAWLGQSDLEPEPGDKRFADPAWKENPFYRAWLQTYLAWRNALHRFVDADGFERLDAERNRFAVTLLTETLAPTNSWLGNPAAIRKFFDTGGASALRGLTHALDDIAQNGGMPAQVDKKAFQVGKNLALTPGAVVYRNEVLELIQYAPATEMVYGRPLLMVPPQINKYYVLDLAPRRSVIEHLVNHGVQTFALSWRNPTPAQRDWGLETYLQAILQAMEAVRDVAGSEDLNLMGACSGGITATLLLAHLAAKGDHRVNAFTSMVTVLDTSVESQTGLFATRETIEAARQASRLTGVLAGRELARVFAWMRPNDLVWNYWVNNYLLGNDPPAFDILYWNNDTTNLPARLHSDFLDLFLANPLRTPGTLTLLGTPIDVAKVNCDSYLLAGITDHITPWMACYATTQMLGGRCEFVLSSSGHIQSILNPPGNPKARFLRNPQLPPEPDAWLAGAQQHAGSWWDHWRDWLTERSGERETAPKTLGSRRFPPDVKAPGTYVFEA